MQLHHCPRKNKLTEGEQSGSLRDRDTNMKRFGEKTKTLQRRLDFVSGLTLKDFKLISTLHTVLSVSLYLTLIFSLMQHK